jgi:hypothetical protein
MNLLRSNLAILSSRGPQISRARGDLRLFGLRLRLPRRAFPIKIVLALLAMTAVPSLSVETTPPRLFFSDAQLSVAVPSPWQVSPTFPVGPLLTRDTPEKTKAFIDCQISEPVDSAHATSVLPTGALKAFAAQDATSRSSQGNILNLSSSSIAGQDAYQATWEITSAEGKAFRAQSIYFFFHNRYYVLTLRAPSASFSKLIPEYEGWLANLRFLSRQHSASLDDPAHGGIWIHQTGGARIVFGQRWLIGVADDHQVGATIAQGRMHLDFTAAMGPISPRSREFGPEEIEHVRQMVLKKGFTIISEMDEPFHGYSAFQLTYEGTANGRFLRGQDIWVGAAKARWLMNIEGDAPLMRQLAPAWRDVLESIRFYE